MKRFYKALVFIVFLPLGMSAQNYGQVMYPHSAGGSKMCDALTLEQHTLNAGYVMVGYKDTSAAGAYNFIIDRTVLGGAVSLQNNTFQKAYQIHANPNEECDLQIRPVNNCAGVSIIETNGANGPGQIGARFALAGAYSEACFFALLDPLGNALFSTSYKFPSRTNTLVTQPKIIECTNTPGEYIICGGFNRTMYAFRIDASGNILWSHLYPIEGEPRDMIAAAFGPNMDNEFIVVGKTWMDAANNGIDGFLMKLEQQNGNVVIFRRLHMFPYNAGPNNLGNQYFNTIEVVKKEYPSPFFSPNWLLPYGYAVGGYSDAFSLTPAGTALHYRVDSVLWHQNLDIYTSPLDTTGGEIVDILRRQRNVPNNRYHYYLLMKTDSGITVIKRDNIIQAINPAQGFHYKNPGKVMKACKLGMVNDMTSVFGGLQIYGTIYNGLNATLPAHNIIKTYFTGETACNSFTSIPMSGGAATQHFIDIIVPFGGLNRCPSFNLTSKEDPGYTDVCGPLSSITGGDNSRIISSAGTTKPEGTLYAKLYPNPAKTNCTITYAIQQNSRVKLELYNMLGQWVCTVEDEQKEAGTYQTEIKLSELGLEKGMYFVNYSLGGETGSCKLLYERD